MDFIMENRLWYDHPAKVWTEALPVGNGKLGAMIYGSPIDEHIQLNEDSVWSGSYVDRNNHSCQEYLSAIRKEIALGNLETAERLSKYALTGTPDGERIYQTLGDLYISHYNIAKEISDYRRELDLNTAVCTTGFTAGSCWFKREVFASAPDNVLVVRLTSQSKLNFHVKIGRRRFMNTVWHEDNRTIAYNGGSGIEFCCMLSAVTTGGTCKTAGEYLLVENANEAVLYLTAATTFRHTDPREYCLKTLQHARDKGFYSIYQSHLQDYQAIYKRSGLILENPKYQQMPTDKRLADFAENRQNQSLFALYYNYGRYLLISCSRKGSLPANLQGIWCEQMNPPWDSKYTININTQMNYWPAEICNLAECHLPLFAHLEKMYPHGVKTAKTMYGVNGWVAHHNTDIWGDTAPQDTYIPSTFWVLGAAWLCSHIWEHFLYSRDCGFLKAHYYLIKEACTFFLEYMIEDDKGRLIVSPTVSPENVYQLENGTRGRICNGCAMDSQIIRELFENCIQAGKIIDEDSEFLQKLTATLEKIPTVQVGKDGRIMEWLDEYHEPEPGHRHISHLYSLFPGHHITAENNPELALAARKTLEHRLANGGGHTGWSRAWIINFWAALRDRDLVQENLNQLLIKSTLPNMFDNHPPFQIDGNFGATAGIANSLMQSTPHQVILLPALPKNWPDGKITGLRAKGGLSIDISWSTEKLTTAEICAGMDYSGTVIYNGRHIPLVLSAGESVVITSES